MAPGWRVETVYLTLAAVFGLAFAVLTPPFQAPDEGNHFLRAYQLSQLQLVGEKRDGTSGGVVPAAVFTETHVFDRVMFRPDVHILPSEVTDRLRHSARFGSPEMAPVMFGGFPNTVRYSPVPYLPQVLALWIARAFGLTVVAGLYLCRLFTLAVSIGFVYTAIRLLPEALKWSIAALALLPMGLFMMSIASTDAFLISLSVLAFGLAVWLREHPDEPVMGSATAWAIAGCVVGIALSKLAYFLVPAAIAIALFNRTPAASRRAVLLLAVVGVAFVSDLGWQALVEPIRTAPRLDPALDAAQQFRRILHDPWLFARVVISDVSRRKLQYYDSFIGKLGYLDVLLPRWVLTSFTAIFALFSVTRCRREAIPRFTRTEQGLLLGIPIVTMLVVMLLQYLDWATVGAVDLRGAMQGRYFYPVAPALLILTPRVPLGDRWALYRPVVLGATYGILTTVTLGALIARYY